MKHLFYCILFALALGACTKDIGQEIASGSGKAIIVHSAEDAVSGEMIVRFRPEAEETLRRTASDQVATRSGIHGLDKILEDIGATAIEPVFNITERNREAVYRAGLHLWYTLRFSSDANLESVASGLAEVAEINVVQYNVRVKRVNERKAIPAGELPVTRTQQPFDDPYLAKQWHCINTGSNTGFNLVVSPGMAGVDVGCAEAWKLCTGDPSVIVAVVDEGVQYNHPDLAANMWVNEAEMNGKRGTDDDGNGYIDDVYGRNFAEGYWGSSTSDVTWNKPGDTGHATHVAGIISAVNGNGTGCCGIAGGSGQGDGVRIMSCQIFSGRDAASAGDTAEAIQYAADNGAVILQCSWGYSSAHASVPAYQKGPASDKEFAEGYSAEKAAIDYFIANAGSDVINGGLAIFATGNETASLPSYPAGYEPCVAVAAIAPDFTPSSFTNYGEGTDICAPGGDSDYTQSIESCIFSTIPNDYGYLEGTSMACPNVSGVAALGLSYAKKLGKHYTASEFRSMLLSAVVSIDPYLVGPKHYYQHFLDIGKTSPKAADLRGYKDKMGSGLSDAWRLLMQVEGTACFTVVAGSSTAAVIDPMPCFGGSTSVKIKRVSVSDADREVVGMTECTLSQNMIHVACEKPGVAMLEITASVGGSAESSDKLPIDTEVTKRIALAVRDSGTAENGGWL